MVRETSRRIKLTAFGTVLLLVLGACATTPDDASTETTATVADQASASPTASVDTVAPGSTTGPASEPPSSEALDAREIYTSISTNPAAGTLPYSAVPSALGFWSQQNLEVHTARATGTTGLQILMLGDEDVRITGTGSPMAVMAEYGAPVVSYYNVVSKNAFPLAVLDSGPIQSISDLAGGTIGLTSLDTSLKPFTDAYLTSEGVDVDSVEFLPVGNAAEACDALESGTVDALSISTDTYALCRIISGNPLRLLTNELSDSLEFMVQIWANSDWFYTPEGRDAAIRFARGVAQGTVFAKENPAAAIRLNWEHNPDTRPAPAQEQEVFETSLAGLCARLEDMQPVDGLWGNATDDQVSIMKEVLVNAGFVNESIHRLEPWDGSLIDEINDFDEEAIRSLADEYTNADDPSCADMQDG